MSSTTGQNYRITSVSHSFVVEWTLEGKDLENLSEKNSDVLYSDVFQIKTVKDLCFYLELAKPYYYKLIIKSSHMWSFNLNYAFCIVDGRAYKTDSTQPLFLNEFNPYCVTDKDVKIYCLVTACSAGSGNKDNLVLRKGQNTVDLEDIINFTLPANYKNEVVINFIKRGEIPAFDVDMAIKIINETKDHKCEVLKILSMEYLISNITAANLRKISKVSVENDLRPLERACLEKISYGRFKIS